MRHPRVDASSIGNFSLNVLLCDSDLCPGFENPSVFHYFGLELRLKIFAMGQNQFLRDRF